MTKHIVLAAFKNIKKIKDIQCFKKRNVKQPLIHVFFLVNYNGYGGYGDLSIQADRQTSF